jgi:hypothetical protein
MPTQGLQPDRPSRETYDDATGTVWSPRELAVCGVFGAAALLLPGLFHLVRLGQIFMPMYLPLVVLGFLVRPRAAALTAFVTPLLSGALTGMPPFFPPVAVFMALELSTMAGVIAALRTRWPRLGVLLLLVPVLAGGRVLYVLLVYAFASVVSLPPGFAAGLSLLSGWPGVLLMIATVPAIVSLASRSGLRVP